jgi:alpha-beta hydrolase superfamily lysophospholipase
MPRYNLWGHTDLDIEIPEEIFPDETFRNEKDILFDNPQHGYFESCHEGKKLHYRKNLPSKDTPLRAILVWQHGIHGQSGYGMRCSSDGRYCDMALRVRMMNAKGIAVYAHDQLGHGFSEGERFYIPNGDWRINRDDFIRFARIAADDHPEGTPLILAGDSYGGCLAFHAAHVFQTEQLEKAPKGFLGCALNCPAFDGDMPAWPILSTLRYILAPMLPRWTPFFMPHPITPERCWKEVEARETYTDQSKLNGLSKGGEPFCLGTAVGLINVIESAQELFSTFDVPFHINHGTDDYGVPYRGSEQLLKQSKTPTSDKELNIVDGGYHGLFSQLDAEDTMRHEIEWMEKMIMKRLEKS